MPFNTRVMEASKRRNTSPTTSTLHMIVEDMDCSGLTAPPEDGEFIVAAAGSVNQTVTAQAANTADLTPSGAQLRMVWGSARRSDRQAQGDQSCPVIMKGGGRFTTKYFLTDNATAPSAAGYAAGMELTWEVLVCLRLVAIPIDL